jgi:hypothetical protein
VVLRCVVPEQEIGAFLIDSGGLSAAESMIRKHVEEACALVLIELAQRWASHKL